MTSPLWVTIVVAALGILGTLFAALVTQSLTTKREAARGAAALAAEQDRSREELAREAQRSREEVERQAQRARAEVDRAMQQERWRAERAEQNSSAAEQRAAYSEFLMSAGRWERYIGQKRDHRLARNGGAVPIEAGLFEDAVDRAFVTVQVLGAPRVVEAATAVYHNLIITMVHLEASHFSVNRVDEGSALVTHNLATFLDCVREDLGVDPATPRSE